jgi:hypothetical protein
MSFLVRVFATGLSCFKLINSCMLSSHLKHTMLPLMIYRNITVIYIHQTSLIAIAQNTSAICMLNQHLLHCYRSWMCKKYLNLAHKYEYM